MKVGNLVRTITCTLGVGMLASTALAQDWRVAPGLPAAHPGYSVLYESFVNYLPEAIGEEFRATILGPEVVDARGVKSALETGIIQVALVLPLYFPAEFPNFSSIGGLALSNRDPLAAAAAMTDFIVNCDECQREFSDAGLVFLGANATDAYVLLTTKPVTTVADLQGMRLRSGGAPFTRWAESVGAVGVNIPINDIFEAMSQGAIDGTISSASDLVSMRLVDVAKHVTLLEVGNYNISASFVMRQDIWNGLDLDQREKLIGVTNRASMEYTQNGYVVRGKQALEQARAAGLSVIEPDEALLRQFAEFAAADVNTAVEEARKTFGITAPDEKFATYLGLMEKWEGLSEEHAGDVPGFVSATFDGIWGDVDLSSYGQ